MARQHYYAWGIKRKKEYPGIRIMSGWDYCGNHRNFPGMSARRHEARLFDTEDKALLFWWKKGEKYLWFLKQWSPRRIKYWLRNPDNRIMIGEKASNYIFVKEK